jgi:hypothetical protein
MSMSTHVVGFHPPDGTWKKMKQVWDACKLADIEPPDRVWDFFGGEEPDDAGVTVELQVDHRAVKPYKTNSEEGLEIILENLPPDVTIIRFYNSW